MMPILDRSAPDGKRNQPAGEGQNRRKMRVLVEDDRKVASFLLKELEEEGHAVDVLHDFDDAGVRAQISTTTVELWTYAAIQQLSSNGGIGPPQPTPARKADPIPVRKLWLLT
jgi:hypothetical protein